MALAGHRWLWDALQTLETGVVTSELVPRDWDWNRVHPVHGTPLMATIAEAIRLRKHNDEQSPVWGMLRWCLRQGADPRKEAGKVTGQSAGWGHAEVFPKLEPINHTNHSAISLAIAIKLSCKQHENHYEKQIKNADIMLKTCIEFATWRHEDCVTLPVAVVDLWESVMGDTGRSDVEMKVVATDGASHGTLRAHSVVLARASRVLDALLSSPMREGRTGVIDVKGASLPAATLLLQLVYSGTARGVQDTDTLLGALDLAHRWQIGHVVNAAERTLAREVTPEHFRVLCEAAVLKELPVLRAACLRFANSSRDFLAAVQRGDFGSVATRLCGRARTAEGSADGSPMNSKQRRVL